MALAFDAATGSSAGAGGTTLTYSHTTSGSNRGLFVGAGCLDSITAPEISGVTYAGVSMSPAGSVLNDVVTPDVEIRATGWTLVDPASGPNNVVVSYAASGAEVGSCAVSFTDANQTDMAGTPATATGATATAIVDATSAADEIVVDFVYTAQNTVTVGSLQTSRNEQENINFESSCGSSTELGAATTTMSWSLGTEGLSNHWAIVAVPIKPVDVGPLVRRGIAVRSRDGSAWPRNVTNVRSGSVWLPRPVRHWDGSNWS